MLFRLIFALSLILSLPPISICQISDFIHVDQFGYLTGADKVAVISDPVNGYNGSLSYSPGSTFQVRDFNNDAVVFTGSIVPWNGGAIHAQSGDRGWWFDFSNFTTPGTYYVYDTGTQAYSSTFKINANPYFEVLDAAMKMFYYNRCNAPKLAPYAAVGWTDGNNFLNPLQDANCRDVYNPSNASTEKELSGGWFDAGDYNKYVSFAHSAVHDLLSSYEENPSIYTDDKNIPESGNGLPDILDEIKWELDWLLKMNNNDGSTHIKMGSISHQQNVSAPPSLNTDQRYYAPTCTSASIANASMLAHASKVFAAEAGMTSFATLLENEAIKCWNYFIPRFNANTLETNCDDGTVLAGDADRDEDEQKELAITAAVYLFELTGDAAYNTFVINHYDEVEPMSNDFWGPYKMQINDALLLYTTLPGADAAVRSDILNSAGTAVSNNWNDFYAFSNNDLYRAESPDWMYHWGSNLARANLGVLCHLFEDYNVSPASNNGLLEKAAEQLHFFHGVNPLGLVHLSNMYAIGADRSANEIYHTWFNDGTDWDNAVSSTYGPAPGFVTGGPNKDYTVANISPPYNQPIQKSYLDFNDGYPNNSWEISEPAIYYQASFVRFLARYVNTSVVSSDVNITATNNCVELFPNPTGNFFYVRGILDNYTLQVLDANGSVHSNVTSHGSEAVVDISALPSGMYFLHVQSNNNVDLCVQKIIKE